MNIWLIVSVGLLAIIGNGIYKDYKLGVAEREWRGENGFSWYSTAEDVSVGMDLTGKVALVTGANSGIGFETARVMALRHAHVIVVARSAYKATDAIKRIAEQLPSGAEYKMTPLVCDLSSLKSVDQAVKDFRALKIPLNYFIANAGIMALPQREASEDGFEKQVAVNHLGHFHLVTALMDIVEKSAPARVVMVSSTAHEMSPNPRAFLESETLEMPYIPWGTYGDSKLANIIFSTEINARYQSKGVLSYAIHPGMIETNLGRYMNPLDLIPLLPQLGSWFPLFGRSIPQGSGTTVYAALTAPDSEAGLYLSHCNVERFGRTYQQKDAGLLENQAVRAKFWATSEKLVKQALSK